MSSSTKDVVCRNCKGVAVDVATRETLPGVRGSGRYLWRDTRMCLRCVEECRSLGTVIRVKKGVSHVP